MTTNFCNDFDIRDDESRFEDFARSYETAEPFTYEILVGLESQLFTAVNLREVGESFRWAGESSTIFLKFDE